MKSGDATIAAFCNWRTWSQVLVASFFAHVGVRCRGDKERVNGVTTTRFSGFVGLMDPQRSWVARYQRLPPSYAPAVYAVQTKGALPDEVQELLDDRGYSGVRPEGLSLE